MISRLSISQTIFLRFNTLPDKSIQSVLFWIVPLFLVVVVLSGFIIHNRGGTARRSPSPGFHRSWLLRQEHLSVARAYQLSVSQFLRNARSVVSKGVRDLSSAGGSVFAQ